MLAKEVTPWLNRGTVSEFEYEITPGERLPPETRMELPTLSYEQELLTTHVPFENRVAMVSEYVKPQARHMTVAEMAVQLEITPGRVQTLADYIGAQFDDQSAQYELYTLEVIEEEIVWQSLEDSLDEKVSAYALSEYLAKSEVWVKQTAYGLGVYPDSVKVGNRQMRLYPRELLGMLRIILLHTPPANDLYSIGEAEALVGKERDWIARMVEKHELIWEYRTLAESGRVGVHYPQDTIDTLRALAAEIPPAGDWLTATQLGRLVSRDKKWVRDHLGDYLALAEPRIADNMKIEPHYPPEALVYLQQIIETLPPYAGDWMTVGGIASKLGRSVDWVEKRIEQFKDRAEPRLTNKGNRSLTHYPPEVYEELQRISEES